MTTQDEMTSKVRTLRLAVQNLASPPQAQRRYVQLGWMKRAIGNLSTLGAELDVFQRAGHLDEGQVRLIAQLRTELEQRMRAHPGMLDEAGSDRREYLHSHALETEDWHAVRHLARRCWTAIAGAESPFIALKAK
jgi:hypothetical protein